MQPGPMVGAAVAAVSKRFALNIDAGVIAGSGLGALAGLLSDGRRVPYRDIPGWLVPVVPGHPGELHLGTIDGCVVAIAVGRSHLYEGVPASKLGFSVEVLAGLGARSLIVTNAAGGLNPALHTGDIMVLEDHLSLPGLAGWSPLVGVDPASVTTRFPPMTDAYDAELAQLAQHALRRAGLTARSGVYAMVAGPAYETPAEARMLRAIGADAVGMSTVPEVIMARALGMKVLGLSVITNLVRQQSGRGEPSAAVPTKESQDVELEPERMIDLHGEVIQVADRVAPALSMAIREVLATLGG